MALSRVTSVVSKRTPRPRRNVPRRRASILVVEDDLLIAQDIACALEEARYEVVGQVSCARDALAAVERLRPDLVLLDIHLGAPDEGLQIAEALETPVLFVSGRSDVATLRWAGQTLARGFVVKPFSPAQLLASVQLALASGPQRGDSVAAREALVRIAETLAEVGVSVRPAPAPEARIRHVPALDSLSPREREIVEAILKHRRPRQIAKDLFISVHTVRNHLKSIYTKLDVHSQAELIELLVVRDEDD